MLTSVLIANRGEIACRIIRGARKLGMRTIAVFSSVDAAAPHVGLADKAFELAGGYLDARGIIAAAKAAGADCVHPGYGFLSENADFAEACAGAGLVFIGPPPAAIRAMGAKDAAKALMQRAGVPVTPGYHGADQDAARLAAEAGAIGYPVLIKAVAGGGGKGMRRVDTPTEFGAALAGAQREALALFGDARVLIEKLIPNPRHVEIQVFGDSHGAIIHLGERDCSLQRRHQKVIEEAPAPGMTPGLRAAMGQAAVEAARAVGYAGAGTVEFILDGALYPNGPFWFMEMNTRLQVEHPVTEAVTGIDLVEWQFRVAAGGRLPLTQDEVRIQGHAVEARLYAEDPRNGFLPSTGKIWALRLPAGEGLRVDSGVSEGGEVTQHFDPMIAKIIAHGATRDEALDRLAGALGRVVAAGPRTNQAFLKALCGAEGFRAENFDTGFIERNLDALGAAPGAPAAAAVAFGAAAMCARERRALGARGGPWAIADGFQPAGPRAAKMALRADDARVECAVEWADGVCVARHLNVSQTAVFADGFWHSSDGLCLGAEAGADMLVLRGGIQTRVSPPAFAADADVARGNIIVAPMHGKLAALDVAVGDLVKRHQRVAIVEAMKMEHALAAPVAGRVAGIRARAGAQVSQGAVLIVIEADGALEDPPAQK